MFVGITFFLFVFNYCSHFNWPTVSNRLQVRHAKEVVSPFVDLFESPLPMNDLLTVCFDLIEFNK